MHSTNYGFNISTEILRKDINRLTNQLWKLIPMRENGEDWEIQLDTVLLEIVGLGEILVDIKENYLILLSKLNGLKKEETKFDIYRKTIFECISLLREM